MQQKKKKVNNSITKSNQYKSLLIAKIQHPGWAGGCPAHFQSVPRREERAKLALCFGTQNNTKWSQPALIYWRESMMLQQIAYPRPACMPQMESCTLRWAEVDGNAVPANGRGCIPMIMYSFLPPFRV